MADRPALTSKSSKSRLSKQAEVESEDPPANRAEPLQLNIPETRVESFEAEEEGALMKCKVLVRSHAMCADDDTKLNTRRIEKQSSSSKTGSAGSSLSRDSSNEIYTDSTGINLEEFIVSTLHKNQKDRQMLLHLEEEMRKFVNDQTKQVQRFPQMSSYNRMLVHRIAAFFGLDHNVDQTGTCVVVNKTDQTRLPDSFFRDYIQGELFTEEPKRLLRREGQSYEEVRSEMPVLEHRKTRSFEDREEEYERAKARIFNQDSSSSAEIVESPISGYSSDSIQQGLHGQEGARPWSSTDTGSYSSSLDVPVITSRAPLSMHKAGSFGGVPTAYRQNNAEAQRLPRRSNTGAADSDLSPGSLAARQPSIPEGAVIGSPVYGSALPPNQQVVFAVASLDQVPPGAVILNPQTGQPITPSPSSGSGSQFAQPPSAPYLPQAVPQSFVPVDPNTLAGQMHASLSLQQNADRPTSMPYSPSGQVFSYYLQQPSASEAAGAQSNQPLLIPMHSYMQYQSSAVHYLIPPTQPIYTQATPETASTQVTYAQSQSAGSPAEAYSQRLYGCPMTYVVGTTQTPARPVPSESVCPVESETGSSVTDSQS